MRKIVIDDYEYACWEALGKTWILVELSGPTLDNSYYFNIVRVLYTQRGAKLIEIKLTDDKQ